MYVYVYMYVCMYVSIYIYIYIYIYMCVCVCVRVCDSPKKGSVTPYAASCVLEHDRFGGGGVMVWAGIHRDGRTALVRVNGALCAQICWDEIPQHRVVPLINVTVDTFQLDNPRPHTARVCRDFLQQNNVHVLPWSARSGRFIPNRIPPGGSFHKAILATINLSYN